MEAFPRGNPLRVLLLHDGSAASLGPVHGPRDQGNHTWGDGKETGNQITSEEFKERMKSKGVKLKYGQPTPKATPRQSKNGQRVSFNPQINNTNKTQLTPSLNYRPSYYENQGQKTLLIQPVYIGDSSNDPFSWT